MPYFSGFRLGVLVSTVHSAVLRAPLILRIFFTVVEESGMQWLLAQSTWLALSYGRAVVSPSLSPRGSMCSTTVDDINPA